MKFVARNVPNSNVVLIASKGSGCSDLEIEVRPGAIESLVSRRLKEEMPQDIWSPHLQIED